MCGKIAAGHPAAVGGLPARARHLERACSYVTAQPAAEGLYYQLVSTGQGIPLVFIDERTVASSCERRLEGTAEGTATGLNSMQHEHGHKGFMNSLYFVIAQQGPGTHRLLLLYVDFGGFGAPFK